MRSLIGIVLLSLCLAAHAARQRTFGRKGAPLTRSSQLTRALSSPYTSWDPNKTYRLPVVLMSFADCDFSTEQPQQYFDRLFNERGYNLGHGPGCVADYFRDQSNGLFNVVFDVVGPVRLSSNQKSAYGDNMGTGQISQALKQADELLDFTRYDWDGNGSVKAVIVVYAGYGGNETTDNANGCIWPNTGSYYNTFDGVTVREYSASPELWSDDTSCGIGTICHEFCHSLGLPDMYPTDGEEFSVLDEWDLMDGGNYADNGWCPPNLSAHEREFLGWLTPEELTRQELLSDLAPLGDGGKAYRIVNDAYPSEYYLLENRQQEGWDLMLPGHGLLITHVDFDASVWQGNKVNVSPSHHRLAYFHADNHDYAYFDAFYGENEARYGDDGRNLRLAHTAYPYTSDEGTTNDALTDTSVPAATIFHARSDGQMTMGKSVTGIRDSNGRLRLSYSDQPVGISEATEENAQPVAAYDLQGRQVPLSDLQPNTIYIIRYKFPKLFGKKKVFN